jgi:hypothetical protein
MDQVPRRRYSWLERLVVCQVRQKARFAHFQAYAHAHEKVSASAFEIYERSNVLYISDGNSFVSSNYVSATDGSSGMLKKYNLSIMIFYIFVYLNFRTKAHAIVRTH